MWQRALLTFLPYAGTAALLDPSPCKYPARLDQYINGFTHVKAEVAAVVPSLLFGSLFGLFLTVMP